jgi:peptidoglycan/LPS O-acetylase OafA/YrhL
VKRIPELDGVRAIAVSLVILDHYAPFRTLAYGFAGHYGGSGVDIFFVLSGFLITTILLQSRTEPHPYRVFYARRALRILPAYALLLLFVYGAAACLREPIRFNVLLGQLLFLRGFAGSGQLLQHCLAFMHHPASLPGWFRFVPPSVISADYGHLPMTASLGPTWSLSVEEWFYLLWAPVVLLLPRRAIAATAVVICGMGLLLRSLPDAGTSFLTSVDILVSGALLALWMERRESLSFRARQREDRSLAVTATLAALLLVVLSWLHRSALSGTLIELSVAGGFAWIAQHSAGPSPVMRLLRAKPLVYFGSISYMVYLIHLPVYFLVRHGFEVHAKGMTPPYQAWAIALCSITGTLCFSAASWAWLERPLLRRKERMTALLGTRRGQIPRSTSSARKQVTAAYIPAGSADSIASGARSLS